MSLWNFKGIKSPLVSEQLESYKLFKFVCFVEIIFDAKTGKAAKFPLFKTAEVVGALYILQRF